MCLKCKCSGLLNKKVSCFWYKTKSKFGLFLKKTNDIVIQIEGNFTYSIMRISRNFLRKEILNYSIETNWNSTGQWWKDLSSGVAIYKSWTLNTHTLSEAAKNMLFWSRTQSHCMSTRIREVQNVPTTPLYELTYGMKGFNAVRLNGARGLPKATDFVWTKSRASSLKKRTSQQLWGILNSFPGHEHKIIPPQRK